MVRTVPYFVLVLMLLQIATAFVFNESLIDDYENKLKDNKLNLIETRRQNRKKSVSTSSSGKTGDNNGKGGPGDSESLEQSLTEETSSSSQIIKPRKKKDRTPKSTIERKGWQKWHRKCTKCPADMLKKWRDPSIKWICGAYQRARRTFKSLCMMHYRNCQDGTMFTKIADHRCPNGSGQVRPYNMHFFYDYKVVLTAETSDSRTAQTSVEQQDSSSWDTSRVAKLPPI
ncbi:unnamed protein product [Spodoptera littoralis]|uniref:Uncharacterized protein n=1 Tax=Spodoptera littoralis TaxID=7109 RepID=A0A9P0HVQ1_SPOLI|nr:unnamed protein product [Spodoptera littoralis]CAH1636248.1 unnamed protein product [Spodoptera littoralis]